jgi:hypothetical protein
MATPETRAPGTGATEQSLGALGPLTEEDLDWALDFARRAVHQVGPGIPLSKKAMAKVFAETEEHARKVFATRD